MKRFLLPISIAVVPVMFAPVMFALAAGVATVSQQGRAFRVKQVALMRGDTLRFMNDDEFIHQIYVDSPSVGFESDEQPPGQAVDVRFPVAGSFFVRCHIHPKMLLQVDVR